MEFDRLPVAAASSWRLALLDHAAHVLAEGREAETLAYVVPDPNGRVENVHEALYPGELPEEAVVIPLLSGPLDRRLDAVDWIDVDRHTGEVRGPPHLSDPALCQEIVLYADRLWRAWRQAKVRQHRASDDPWPGP